MRKGKYAKRGMAGKTLVLVLALVMLIGGTVGSTLAWLMDKSETVTNTFTDSDINITLTETDTDAEVDGVQHDYKMIPGWTIDKDPEVTVLANSEDCWLFVEIEESDNLGTYITYAIEGGWQTVEDGDNNDKTIVIGRKVMADTADQVFDIIGNKGADGTGKFVADKVLVKDNVTKQMMDDIDGDPATEEQPTLTFTAYAVQLYKTNKPTGDGITDEQLEAAQFTVTEAWAKAAAMKPTTGSGT